MTKNRLSIAGSHTLMASENEFNSTGNFNYTETAGDAPSLFRDTSSLRNIYLPRNRLGASLD